MGYLEIVGIVFAAIWFVFLVMLFQYAVFSIVGIFSKKKFPEKQEKLRYGIVISARNEELVIGELLDSIRKNGYPLKKLQIFVVAHNCTDRTAEVARKHGATVYEYNNDNERTLGYAYRYLFRRIEEEYRTVSFDGFFIFNADNILPPGYLSKMNDAFLYYGKKYAVTSYRNSTNFGENYMSCLYGIFFLAACRYEFRGRGVCGCTSRVSGTGYVLPSSFVENGWDYVTMTEDWEFTADRVAQGDKIMYCDEAEFFDEQPTTVPIMLRQRLRWARGHTIVFFTRFKKLVKAIFTPKKRGGKDNKYSQYDVTMSILPSGAIGIGLLLLQLICLAFSPLFGYDPGEVWTIYAIVSAISFVCSYLVTMLTGVLILILERKHIPKIGFFRKLAAILLWPFFLLLNVVLDVVSLFVRNLKWKPIPHGETRKKVSAEPVLAQSVKK